MLTGMLDDLNNYYRADAPKYIWQRVLIIKRIVYHVTVTKYSLKQVLHLLFCIALLYKIAIILVMYTLADQKNKKETSKHVIPGHAVLQPNYSIMTIF